MVITNKRRKRPALVIALLLLLAGVCVIAYPYINQGIYQAKARKVNEGFEARTGQYSATEEDELYRQMLLYNQNLFENGQSGLADAFSYEAVDFSLRDYGFEEEMIGYLNIPKMKIELPVYLGASRENLNRGAAHLSHTSLPIGGVNSNAVIAAHRGMPTAEMFRHIDVLEENDEILFTNYRETLTYKVAEIAIIQPNEIDRILIRPGEDMLTLISCNPYGSNRERYVVYAKRADVL